MSNNDKPIIDTLKPSQLAKLVLKECIFTSSEATIVDLSKPFEVTKPPENPYVVITPPSFEFKGNFFSKGTILEQLQEADTEEGRLLEILAIPMFCWVPELWVTDRFVENREPCVSPINGLYYSSKQQVFGSKRYHCAESYELESLDNNWLTVREQEHLIGLDMRLRLHGNQGAVLVYGSKLTTGEYVYSLIVWGYGDRPTLLRYSKVHPLLMYYIRRKIDFLPALKLCSRRVSSMFLKNDFIYEAKEL